MTETSGGTGPEAQRRLNKDISDITDPFRLLVDTQVDMFCIHDPKGMIVYANLAYARFFGSSVEDLLGTCIVDLAPEDGRDAARENLENAVAAFNESATQTINEFPLINSDGKSCWIEFTNQPVLDTNGDLSIVITAGRDVSARAEAEKQLREINQKLEESNRDLEDFAYVASHDLQEPLRKIIAFSNRLSDKASDQLDPKNLDYLERISGAAGRMQRLIEDLLEVSRVATTGQDLVPVDLSSVLSDVLSDLEIAIERAGATVHLPQELPKVSADEVQLRQLFQNLIGNALKFRHDNVAPVITIATSRVNRDDLPASLRATPVGEYVKISIADNGIGFDEQHASTIFTIFQRLHGRSEYEGSGIGLSVCKKIVDRHNGDIMAFSGDGEGATFNVTLPLA